MEVVEDVTMCIDGTDIIINPLKPAIPRRVGVLGCIAVARYVSQSFVCRRETTWILPLIKLLRNSRKKQLQK